MKVAIWNEQEIARTNQWKELENNIYFPSEEVNTKYLEPSDKKTVCPWKGEASYFHIKVNEDTNNDAAWTYRDPKESAKEIQGYIAFWKGVTIKEKA